MSLEPPPLLLEPPEELPPDEDEDEDEDEDGELLCEDDDELEEELACEEDGELEDESPLPESDSTGAGELELSEGTTTSSG